MSAIKGAKGIPNGSCILTLRDRPSTERGDVPRPAAAPAPYAVAHPSLSRPQDGPNPAGCSFVQPGELPHTHWGTGQATNRVKRDEPRCSRGPFPLQLPLPDWVVSTIAQKRRPDASRTSQRPSPSRDGAAGPGEASTSRSPHSLPRPRRGGERYKAPGSGRAGGTLWRKPGRDSRPRSDRRHGRQRRENPMKRRRPGDRKSVV